MLDKNDREKYQSGETPRLGDTVSCGWVDGWDTAIVSRLNEDGTIDLFRPYGTTADFSYTGGVMCYVGIETIEGCRPGSYKLLRAGRDFR